MKIKMQTPNTISRDLGNKFAQDHNALIRRTVDLMVPTIGGEQTAGLVMTILACAGVSVEKASYSPPGNFRAFVKIAEEEEKRRGKK